MKIQLDTTYLLSFIGIGIKDIHQVNNVLRYLFTSKHKLLISKISIFEALAKGIKLSSAGVLSLERLLSGIVFLEETPHLNRVEFTHPEVIETTIILKKYINDSIDCIILASSLIFADMLITEDSKILDFAKNNSRFKDLNQLREKPLQVVDLKTFMDLFDL